MTDKELSKIYVSDKVVLEKFCDILLAEMDKELNLSYGKRYHETLLIMKKVFEACKADVAKLTS